MSGRDTTPITRSGPAWAWTILDAAIRTVVTLPPLNDEGRTLLRSVLEAHTEIRSLVDLHGVLGELVDAVQVVILQEQPSAAHRARVRAALRAMAHCIKDRR